MSIDQLPPGFAAYHLVRTDLPRVQCYGRYYNQALVLNDLRVCRERYPDKTWAVLWEGGLLEESEQKTAKPQLRILRRAA